MKKLIENLLKGFYDKEVKYRIEGDNVIFYKEYEKSLSQLYIKQDEYNRIKIGVSNNTDRRNRELETISGLTLKDVYLSKPCTNAYYIESKIHNKFKEFRIKGEWFNLDYNKVIEILNNENFVEEEVVEKVKYIIPVKYIKRLNDMYNTGHWTSQELYLDDEETLFILNCSEEELKNEIIKEANDIVNNFDEKSKKLSIFEVIDDYLDRLVCYYFEIFNNNVIEFDKFRIVNKKFRGEYWAETLDKSFGDTLFRTIMCVL